MPTSKFKVCQNNNFIFGNIHKDHFHLNRVGRGRGKGKKHLDIATNSTDEISKNVQLRKNALHWASERAFSKLNIFGYFIVEFVAVSLGDGGG